MVGENCLLMAYVHIGHDCVLGNNIIISNSTNVAGEIEINDWAVISGAVQIHQFVRIGSHVMISGGSLVRKDVPPYTKSGREPLSFFGINIIGLRRRNFSDETINQIHEIYRIIYQRKLNVSQALVEIEKNCEESAERNEIINFIKSSQRGIIKR